MPCLQTIKMSFLRCKMCCRVARLVIWQTRWRVGLEVGYNSLQNARLQYKMFKTYNDCSQEKVVHFNKYQFNSAVKVFTTLLGKLVSLFNTHLSILRTKSKKFSNQFRVQSPIHTSSFQQISNTISLAMLWKRTFSFSTSSLNCYEIILIFQTLHHILHLLPALRTPLFWRLREWGPFRG